MRYILLAFLFCTTALSLFAQQEPQYTQFMYNKLGLNPGYAGANESTCLTALHRSQWLGLEGAPTTQLVSASIPLSNQRVGLGLNLHRSSISVFQRVSVEGMYAYRIRMGEGYLGIGLQGSVRFIDGDFTDSRLGATEDLARDDAIDQTALNKTVPNFGAGLYYQADNFYIGLSAPRFLKNNIDLNDAEGVIGKEVPHLNFMLGLTTQLSDQVAFKPQVLVKFVDNSPVDIDLNANFVFVEKYMAGLTLRTGGDRGAGLGESLDFLLGAQVVDNLFFGLAYDLSLSKLKEYNNGSIEGVLRYCFGRSHGEDIENPRFLN